MVEGRRLGGSGGKGGSVHGGEMQECDEVELRSSKRGMFSTKLDTIDEGEGASNWIGGRSQVPRLSEEVEDQEKKTKGLTLMSRGWLSVGGEGALGALQLWKSGKEIV